MGRPSKYVTNWKTNKKGGYDRNIHITFNVNEKERILHPIFDEKPDEVIYFEFYDDNTRRIDQNLQKNIDNCMEIEKNCPECKIIHDKLNYVDYFEIVKKLRDYIFTKENKTKKTRITINLLGSKMLSLTVIDAITTWRTYINKFYDNYSIDLFPRYVFSKDYHPTRSEGVHKGKMICVEFPIHTYNIPIETEIYTLYRFSIELLKHNKTFYDNSNEKRDWLSQKDWLFQINKDQDKKRKVTLNEQDFYIKLKPLIEKKNIYRKSIGTDHRIYLTEKGKRMVNFIFLLLSPIIELNIRFNENNLMDLIYFDNLTEKYNNDKKLIPEFESKSHITFNNRETTRIVNHIIDNPPDRLYYFHFYENSRRNDQNLDIYQKNLDKIKSELPNCKINEENVNYVNYFQIIYKIAEIIKKEIIESQNTATQISINLGSGSKLLSLAVRNALHYWNKLLKEKKNIYIDLIYPVSTKFDYDPHRNESISKGPFTLKILPELEIMPPDTQLIKTLFLMHEMFEKNPTRQKYKTITQKELRDVLFDQQILQIEQGGKGFEERKDNQIREKIVKPLVNWQYITVKKDSKNRTINRLHLTENGENIFQIFKLFDFLRD